MPPYYQKTMPWMTYPCSFKTSWSYHNTVAFYIGHPVVPNCICTLAPTSSIDIFTFRIVLLPKIESVCYLQLSPSSHFTGPDRVQPTASVFFFKSEISGIFMLSLCFSVHLANRALSFICNLIGTVETDFKLSLCVPPLIPTRLPIWSPACYTCYT